VRWQAAVVVDTVESLLGSQSVITSELAVITPYMGQKAEILGMMRKRGLMGVSVDTVDSYQGMERDIVMVSTVRANDDGAVGFLKCAHQKPQPWPGRTL
jgi:superfamily I DNA and/or RNA helicase